jgi:hypothetical protein
MGSTNRIAELTRVYNFRDCAYANIMLDPSNMYPESFYPVSMSRSKCFRHKGNSILYADSDTTTLEMASH